MANARTRVIPIISADDRLLGGCAKAGYSSLVSVPIRLQQRVLGEVDLFYRHEVQPEPGRARAVRHAGRSSGQRGREPAPKRWCARQPSARSVPCWRASCMTRSHSHLAFMKIQLSLLRAAVLRSDREQMVSSVDEIDAGVRRACRTCANCWCISVPAPTATRSSRRCTPRSKFEHQSGLKAHLQMRGHGVALSPTSSVAGAACAAGGLVQRAQVRRPARSGSKSTRARPGPFGARRRPRLRGCNAPRRRHQLRSADHARARRAHRRNSQRDLDPGRGTQVTLTLAQ